MKSMDLLLKNYNSSHQSKQQQEDCPIQLLEVQRQFIQYLHIDWNKLDQQLPYSKTITNIAKCFIHNRSSIINQKEVYQFFKSKQHIYIPFSFQNILKCLYFHQKRFRIKNLIYQQNISNVDLQERLNLVKNLLELGKNKILPKIQNQTKNIQQMKGNRQQVQTIPIQLEFENELMQIGEIFENNFVLLDKKDKDGSNIQIKQQQEQKKKQLINLKTQQIQKIKNITIHKEDKLAQLQRIKRLAEKNRDLSSLKYNLNFDKIDNDIVKKIQLQNKKLQSFIKSNSKYFCSQRLQQQNKYLKKKLNKNKNKPSEIPRFKSQQTVPTFLKKIIQKNNQIRCKKRNSKNFIMKKIKKQKSTLRSFKIIDSQNTSVSLFVRGQGR